jgi:hypothetical protein
VNGSTPAAPGGPRVVYGVHVANYYEGAGLVEAVFSTPAAAL